MSAPILVYGSEPFLSKWAEAIEYFHQRDEAWKVKMRRLGIHRFHAENGWVDRAHDRITDWGPENGSPGDLVAIGDTSKWRVVRLLSFNRWRIQIEIGGTLGDWKVERIWHRELGMVW